MHELADVIAADEATSTLVRFTETSTDGFTGQTASYYSFPALIDKARLYQESFDLKIALVEGQALVYIRSGVSATPVDAGGSPVGPAVSIATMGLQTNDKLVVANETYLVEEVFDLADEGFYLLVVKRQPTTGGTA